MSELSPVIMYGQPVADKMFENWQPHIGAKLTIFSNQADPASVIYVKNKKNKCKEFNIPCGVVDVSKMSTEDFFAEFRSAGSWGHYVIVQKPLPNHLKRFEDDIDRELACWRYQDVDAFNGDLSTDFDTPATPLGIMRMLDYYVGLPNLDGMNAVVIGRSKIVGKPISRLLTKANCTVTICHSHTKDLKFYTQHADLIICAVGKPKFLTADMVGDSRPIIVDVGINRNGNGKLCGDVDFENVAPKCSFISPVPKGAGVLTVATLVHKMGDNIGGVRK